MYANKTLCNLLAISRIHYLRVFVLFYYYFCYNLKAFSWAHTEFA